MATKRDGHAAAYLAHHREVEGWLEEITARATDMLLRWQRQHQLSGDVLEIGVHHGRYFLVLANGLDDGERAIAVDLFGDQHLNVSQSGRGAWYPFVRNVTRFAPLAHVCVVKADSATLGDDFVARHAGIRFVSIDGGHDRETACSDLKLAERLARDGCIVALDDIYRPDWSGVTAGLARFYQEGGELVPFAFVPNKLLLTTDSARAAAYRDALRQDFAAYCDKHRSGVEVFDFDDVLLIWNEPR